MGEYNYQTLVIGSAHRPSAERIYAEARLRGLNVSEIIESGKSIYTVVVAPSGSKYGWDNDTAYMQRVSQLADWLQERRAAPGDDWLVCEFALVNFGVGMELELSISRQPMVMRHSKYVDDDELLE